MNITANQIDSLTLISYKCTGKHFSFLIITLWHITPVPQIDTDFKEERKHLDNLPCVTFP